MRVRSIVESAAFNNFIIAVIVFNAVLIGLTTYQIDATLLRAIGFLEAVCVGIYIVEIAMRFVARDSSAEFFRNGWNLFDLVIVVSALIPAARAAAPASTPGYRGFPAAEPRPAEAERPRLPCRKSSSGG